MACRLSVIIPNRNGEETIGLCLAALFRSNHDSFEVIVVDDASTDTSAAIIEQFPCVLVRFERQRGAGAARNHGARRAGAGRLFFIDADCLVELDTLVRVENALTRHGPDAVVGGTYTRLPHDRNFFSIFQSVFIHYAELKNSASPDYVAAHAMAMTREVFDDSAGFPEEFLPIIEDVEYSHRLRRRGYRLVMDPAIQVRHIFSFDSMADSLRNAFRKSRYWTLYSLGNRDLATDSGTASLGLKVNVLLFGLLCLLLIAVTVQPSPTVRFAIMVLLLLNITVNLGLLRLLYETGGACFVLGAALYYMLVYPLAVGAGALTGLADYLRCGRCRKPVRS